ncbi:phage/plasmid primase, P4 family [Aurantimonas sp. MSK8Z-1]|uniref:DNA primase family protein n=1 Tax=Mangrovibrevibacter kandeliae TaxID=2968473 RepID=UPI002118FB0A|nr:DNA primase family protein [Aurantimonas sp. MSK8Z-1]MCW4114762.1 phage/plasmid primase, P4 family [Aurantimonas sp. MSK8Z-1]
MTKGANDNLALVRAALARVFAQSEIGPAPAPEDAREPVPEGPLVVNGLTLPQATDPDAVEDAVLGFCAGLDQSDTDNAYRLIAHFGRDVRVLAQEKAKTPSFVVWTGTHWDVGTGTQRAQRIAQRLGKRIEMEAGLIKPSKRQEAMFAAAAEASAKPAAEQTAADRKTIAAAEKAQAAIDGARGKRRDFGISCRNKSRLEAMLACVAPHLMTDPDAFNANPLRVAVRNATLTFASVEEEEVNPAAERDDSPPDTPPTVTVRRGTLSVRRGHERADLITELVPVAYDPQARCPRWAAFLEEFQPDAAQRRMVQVGFGLGLLGVTVQRLFFHYGNGANGKSVAMEVICRVLGEAAVTLPSSSFFGPSGQAGGASPDIALLHGRRLLRVKELPRGEPLREDLVKELTGGEEMSVRDLYSGYFTFKPIFIAHMSGNDYPDITGTDNGMWRRMAVVLWPKTIPDAEQRDFEDVVGEFMAEAPGILNWLIEGAKIFLTEGLVIPEQVARETQKYRDDMDPTSGFVSQCVRPKGDEEVLARDLYRAYVAWAEASAVKPITETRFGRIMGKKFQRLEGAQARRYVGIALVNVPKPEPVASPYPDGYGGER